MLFSIIMPVYNAEFFLKKGIQSVLDQTYINFELIIVNDGSTDKSLELIYQYQESDSRIKVINQMNQGVSVARNNGIKAAVGEYVGFLDSDDYIDVTLISEVASILSKYWVDIIDFDFKRVANEKIINKVPNDIEIGLYTDEDIKFDIFPNLICNQSLENDFIKSVCNKFFKLSFIKNNNLTFNREIPIGEDYLFTVESMLSCTKYFHMSNKGLYHYLDNVDSVTHNKIYNRWNISVIFLEELKKLINNKIINQQYDNELIRSVLSCVINESFSDNNKVKPNREVIKAICYNSEVNSTLSNYDEKKLKISSRIILSLVKNKLIHILIFILYVNGKYRLLRKV